MWSVISRQKICDFKIYWFLWVHLINFENEYFGNPQYLYLSLNVFEVKQVIPEDWMSSCEGEVIMFDIW